MTKTKRILAWTLISSSLLLFSGCADDRLMKTLAVIGITGGAAYVGHQIAGPGNRGVGAVLGGAGGVGVACMLLGCFGGSGITGGNR